MSLFPLAEPTAVACAVLGAFRGLAKTATMYKRYQGESDQVEVERGEIISVPIAEVVYADLRGRSAKQNTSVGQLSAELLALATGQVELVREFDLEMLCLPAVLARISDRGIAHRCMCTRIRTEVCVARPVYADICEYVAKGPCDVGQVAADLLAIATGHPEAVRHLDREAALELAGEK